MVSVESAVVEATRSFLADGEVILALEYVSLIDGRGIPGGPANRRRRSRVVGDLLSGFLPDTRWVSGRVAGGEANSVSARMASALRTDEYADLHVQHYLVITNRRVLVIGRSLPNAALAIRPMPWSPLRVGCELHRTDVASGTRTRRGFNTARLRLDFADRSWLMLSPSIGNRGGKVDRLVESLSSPG